jgi:GntR family transcriptional regulator / MocR family aminotransferase
VLAARGQAVIAVEDPGDAEYRYDREPVGALQGVAPGHVIYIGSLSKSLAPALRLGWLVVPAALRDDVIAARALTDRFTTPIIQAAAAEFIARGDLDRHLRRTRRSYRQRRDALIGGLQRHLPGTQATGISAGLHVVVRLPGSMDPARVAATAARHGILVHPLGHYRASAAGADPPALRYGLQQAHSAPDRGRHPAPGQHCLTGARGQWLSPRRCCRWAAGGVDTTGSERSSSARDRRSQ